MACYNKHISLMCRLSHTSQPFEEQQVMDRRQIKTQAQIKQVFIQLLAQQPLDKITVAQLADTADINRGTFYRYYRDMYDLHDHLVASLISDITQIFSQNYPTTTENHAILKALSHQLVAYIGSHQDTVAVLLRQPTIGAAVFQQVKVAFIQKACALEATLPNNSPDTIEINFIVSGIMGLVMDFVTQNLAISAATLDQNIYALLRKF